HSAGHALREGGKHRRRSGGYRRSTPSSRLSSRPRALSLRLIATVLLAGCALSAQQKAPDAAPDPQRWNLHFQITGAEQGHGPFDSPYAGPLSLRSKWEAEPSLTATIYFGLRLWTGAALYFDGEVAGGKG